MLLYQISNRLVCTFYASLCIFGYIILIKNTGKFYYFLTKVTITSFFNTVYYIPPPAQFSIYKHSKNQTLLLFEIKSDRA